MKPLNIPAQPNEVYKGKGWVDMGTFLGTFRVQSQKIVYPTFSECKEIAINNNISTNKEWMKYCRNNLHLNLPAAAYRQYKEWKGWDDFLDKQQHYTYNEAKKILKKYNFQTVMDYAKAKKKEVLCERCPNTPSAYYKGRGFISYADLFSNGKKKKIYISISYIEAKTILEPFKLTSLSDYHNLLKSKKLTKGITLPYSPARTYKNKGWKDWEDYLNAKITNPKDVHKLWYSYDKARKFMKTTNIKTRQEWRAYCKKGLKPDFLPSNPDKAYKGRGWISAKDWFGKE